MNFTDIITFILSVFFLMRGASRGFIKSLTVPLSVAIATVVSIIYYQKTGNIWISSIIGLFGPFILNLLFKFIIGLWINATNSSIKPNFLSRFAGAFLTLMWGWVFIIFTLILLNALPPWGNALTDIRQDVNKSTSILIAKPFENIIFPGSKPNFTSTPVLNEPPGSDAKSLANDPWFQTILQDPEIQKEIDAHDIAGLMRNPKMMGLVQQVMSDPATMQKVMDLYKNQSLMPNQASTETSGNP